jgi:hypothetical protein
MSPTIGRFTDPGTVLGTVGYMSPEQVRGEPGDHRSDIFSFGAVLYELVSGRRAFQRSTAAETMTAILREETPPLDDHVSGGLPPALGHIVQHCLEKSPGERFQKRERYRLRAPGSLWIVAVERTLAGRRAGLHQALAVAGGGRRRGGGDCDCRIRRGAPECDPASAVSFTPLTYVDQTIFRGLFAPDGKTIVFSATLNGVTNDVELFTLSADYPEPRPLGLRNTQLLSVSPRGELAVLTKVRFLSHRLFEGTLARAPLGGGAPREILEHVREADWAPDGEALAIIRDVSGIDRLEFPIGKVLYESSGYLSDLRVSPTGDRIAFLEHPLRYDRSGRRSCGRPEGNEEDADRWLLGARGTRVGQRTAEKYCFAAGLSIRAIHDLRSHAIRGSAARRSRVAGGLTIYDIAADGRWLAARDDISRNMFVKAPGAAAEANLSWLDFSSPVRLTKDGRTLLFTEESGAVGSNLRRVSSTRLTAHYGCERSAKERLPICLRMADLLLGIVQRTARDELMLYPTGSGRTARSGSRLRSSDTSTHVGFPTVLGSWSAAMARVSRIDAMCRTPRRTPAAVSLPSGPTMHGHHQTVGQCVVHQDSCGHRRRERGRLRVYPIAGGAPRPIRWTSRTALTRLLRGIRMEVATLSSQEGTTLTLSRVDLATGRRDFLRAPESWQCTSG